MKFTCVFKSLAFIIVSFFSFSTLRAQPNHSLIATDRWKGFERCYFQIGNHSAYYVKPKAPLSGSPWVWRSSFPDWHTEIDSLLLEKGFYVAYVSVDDQYGSPYAMQVWDQFYKHLVQVVHLSNKPALEAVSRGALYAIGWAKRNPDKVSCIYAETPVYDIKSWPGGKGKGPGDTAAWKQLMRVYHFTEQQAIAFQDNPVNHLEGLASFKVPVLNVIGLYDQVAPREENTDIFMQRYTALGGPAAVYPVTDGPQELQGHHFPINNAAKYADFIMSNAYPVKPVLPYRNYITIRNGLNDVKQKIGQGQTVTVAFVGGSITFNPGWRDKVCQYLQERFPQTHFRFIAAGIPSLGSLPHAFRLQRDVLDSGKVDLMFLEAAVNDRVNGTDSLTQVLDLEGIVRHARRTNAAMDIVMMAFADPEKNSDYDQGNIPAEVANQELVASHYHLPSINLAKEVHDKIKNHEFSWGDDFKDIHPSPFGQELYFATIKSMLDTCLGIQNTHLMTGAVAKQLPRPINKANFEHGSYYSITRAQGDSNWAYDQHWQPADHAGTRPGFVNVPVLYAENQGAELSLRFKGTAIGMGMVSGPDAGVIAYAIDDAPFKEIDLFTPWSNYLHLPWYVLFGSRLKNGNHILKLKIADHKNAGSKGYACRIVYFLKND
jgi:sialidase-1